MLSVKYNRDFVAIKDRLSEFLIECEKTELKLLNTKIQATMVVMTVSIIFVNLFIIQY